MTNQLRRTVLDHWKRMGLVACVALTSCQQETPNVDLSISAYRDRMLVRNQQEQERPAPPDVTQPLRREPRILPATSQPGLASRAALPSEPPVTELPSPEAVLAELPDPGQATEVLAMRLERLRQEQEGRQDQRVVRNYQRVVAQTEEYLRLVALPHQIGLSLSECIQRAIGNNYTVRIAAHDPAIAQTRIVEAEAAFDAQFFLDYNWVKSDPATPPGVVPATADTRTIRGGIRKLLATGMVASVGLATSRQWSGLPQGDIKTWNPTWPSNFVADFRQPLLQGFGLDVNRAQIEIAQLNYGISYEDFISRVRDTLTQVETAYWQLMQTRRQAAIFAEIVAHYLITYQNMLERLDLDATQVEVANAQSRWQSQYVAYLETVKLVRDAEDRLKNLMNDPDFLLSQELEIIPMEIPFAAPIVLDHFAEVRTALEQRSEVTQARDRIRVARVGTNVAKNAVLPQLDLTFSYEVQGIGVSADDSFDNLTTNRFISYAVGVSFTYDFGERADRARYRRARLQESQAVVALNQLLDSIVEEMNVSIRTLVVRYTQLPPQLEAVVAAERNLRALQARTQRIDPSYLQTELQAVEQLGNTRTTLLRVLTDYNIGIVDLERAKGTLLEYNNISVTNGMLDR